MAEVYGYIRVSSRDQNEGRQRIALMEAGLTCGAARTRFGGTQ